MPLSHAILGFLEFRPMTGYDLKKYFDQSIAHFWSATKSHIYQALEKLEQRGFVVSQIIPHEGSHLLSMMLFPKLPVHYEESDPENDRHTEKQERCQRIFISK